MKCFAILCLVATLACAQAYSGIAFMEDLRSRPDGKIIMGTPAVNGQFPHQIFLLISQSSGGRSACGGSLIGSRWVMTAGHCVRGFVSAQVHMGNVAHASSPVVVTTSNLVPHPNYNPNNLNNDIGLIGLTSDVATTANIRPIAIPTSVSETYVGRVATVSGFGLTSNTGSVSPTLNYANVSVITNAKCAGVFGNSVIIASTICVEGIDSPSQGTCNGDSGGPLVVYETAGVRQIGVVSFGSSAGCSAAYPSGFVRPYHFLSWISSVTGMKF